MAIFKTTTRTQQEARKTSLHSNPSFRPLQQAVHFAMFEIVLDGTEVTGDDIELGSLGLAGAVVIPELSRITDVNSVNDMGANFVLEAVNPETLAVTALTATSIWANNSAPFVRLASGETPEIAGSEDFLQVAVTLPTGAGGATAIGVSGDKISVLIAYGVTNS